jgi:hypothetical protein
MHDATHTVFLPLNQKVYVIAHQTIRIEEEWQFNLLRRQQRKELLVVGRRIKNPPAIIAANNNVIQTAFDFCARFPGHGPRMLLPSYAFVNAKHLH